MHWLQCPYHVPLCMPFLSDWWLPRLLFISPGLTALCSWTKERLKEGNRGKEVILSKPDPRASCFGGSLSGMRGSYCPSCSRGWGFFKIHWYGGGGWLGGVGEKFEFLLNSVITTGIVTKRHFDKCMSQDMNIASPRWLYEMGGIYHSKSTHWHVSALFRPGMILVLQKKRKGRWIWKRGLIKANDYSLVMQFVISALW